MKHQQKRCSTDRCSTVAEPCNSIALKIQSTIQTSKRFGMITLDDYLLDLARRGEITPEVAVEAAQNREDLSARLNIG